MHLRIIQPQSDATRQFFTAAPSIQIASLSCQHCHTEIHHASPPYSIYRMQKNRLPGFLSPGIRDNEHFKEHQNTKKQNIFQNPLRTNKNGKRNQTTFKLPQCGACMTTQLCYHISISSKNINSTLKLFRVFFQPRTSCIIISLVLIARACFLGESNN
jgi:hypothetical protein